MSDPTKGRPAPRGDRPVEPQPVRDVERRPPATEDRSIMDLVRSLADDTRTLFRQEVALVRTEMSEKMEVYQRSMVTLVIGAVFLLAAVLIVLWAINMGVTALFSTFVDPAVAVWLAPLILGIIVALIGYGMLKGATGRMKAEGVVPEQTMETLRDDKDWVKEQVRHD